MNDGQHVSEAWQPVVDQLKRELAEARALLGLWWQANETEAPAKWRAILVRDTRAFLSPPEEPR